MYDMLYLTFIRERIGKWLDQPTWLDMERNSGREQWSCGWLVLYCWWNRVRFSKVHSDVSSSTHRYRIAQWDGCSRSRSSSRQEPASCEAIVMTVRFAYSRASLWLGGFSRANKQDIFARMQICKRYKGRFLKWDSTLSDRISPHGWDVTNFPYITPDLSF